MPSTAIPKTAEIESYFKKYSELRTLHTDPRAGTELSDTKNKR